MELDDAEKGHEHLSSDLQTMTEISVQQRVIGKVTSIFLPRDRDVADFVSSLEIFSILQEFWNWSQLSLMSGEIRNGDRNNCLHRVSQNNREGQILQRIQVYFRHKKRCKADTVEKSFLHCRLYNKNGFNVYCKELPSIET